MSDYIKYMYREYLEGRTRIKKVNEDQPLFPNTGAGLLIQKNKLTDDWTALNVSDGHYEEESFNHEALAAAFLQGANMGQLRMLNEILDRARLNGPYCLENVADALLSFAPACKAESLMENPMLHFIELSKSFSKNGGIYDPVHGIYIDSKVNGLGDVPHFTLYDVSVADIEECMAWGTKHLDVVPGQIHVVNGSPHIATIYVTGPDDRRINDLIFTLCEDGRWSYVSELDAETLARFNEIIAKADRIEAGIVKDDEWRDGMVEQVSGFMDKIKDMDAEEAEGADTVLAETFNSIDALSTDAAIDLLRVYSNCDASGRDAVAKTFYALSCKTSRLRSCPMRKIVPILCILALSLSGCRATTLLRNGVDELRDYIASENAKTKKKLNDRRNEKISTLNRAISEKNEEIIFELMADDLRKDGDKLKSQLKDFVNFIPGKIVETSNHSWGTLIHAENYKDAPDNVIEKKIWPHDDEGNYYCSVRVYRLSYLAIDDRGTEYMITMEYIKSNEANPEEIGLNYVSIFKTDPDSDEIIRAGRTWE